MISPELYYFKRKIISLLINQNKIRPQTTLKKNQFGYLRIATVSLILQ